MFDKHKADATDRLETGYTDQEINRSGFEQFEEKYHKYDDRTVEESLDYDDSIMDLCEINLDEMRELAGVIDTYIEAKMTSGIDIDHVDADEIFDEDEFIAIIKPYSDGCVIPGIFYWNTLKMSFIEYQGYNSSQIETTWKERTPHEKRVRAVSELLIACLPHGAILRLGYQAITGKEPEILSKLDDTISEKIVDATDATAYLAANAGLGCIKVVENAVEYGAAGIELVAGNKESAEKIMSLDISGDLKAKLDEAYGRDNWVRNISDSVERFGTTATYIGLTMLLSGTGISAVAGGVGLVLGKAGEKVKADLEKTDEFTSKEMVHGLISGAVMLGCAELGFAAVDKLGSSTPAIANELNKMFGGNLDPKMLKTITNSVVNGLEAGTMFTAYDVPEQVSKEIERALDIDPDAKADWSQTLGGAGIAILTAATFTFIKELYVNRGFYSTYEERINRTPVENGEWTGERGESTFISNSDEVTEYTKSAGVDGVNYKDGCPDFSPFSKGDVEIPDMSTNRYTSMGKPGNFEQADAALAQQRGNGCTPRDVANWRKENGYTWHELNDMKTCQKVPTSVNKVYRHLGGVSECKHREDMMNEIVGKYTSGKGGVFDE